MSWLWISPVVWCNSCAWDSKLYSIWSRSVRRIGRRRILENHLHWIQLYECGFRCIRKSVSNNGKVHLRVLEGFLGNFSWVWVLHFVKLYDGCNIFSVVRFYYIWSNISELLASFTLQEIKYEFIRLYIWYNAYIQPYTYTLPHQLYVRPNAYIWH